MASGLIAAGRRSARTRSFCSTVVRGDGGMRQLAATHAVSFRARPRLVEPPPPLPPTPNPLIPRFVICSLLLAPGARHAVVRGDKIGLALQAACERKRNYPFMNTATGGTHDDRVRSTDAVRAGIEMAACVRTFSELSPEKRIRCLFRNPYEVVDLLQQLPAGTIPACIAQGVDLDLFLQLLHRSDRLPCRIAYADGDIVVTRLTTSSYHAGAADVFTSILTSMAPLGSFGDYADTGFQMGNFVIGADRALQTRPPTSAPPGEFTSTTGNRRTPSIVVEACVGQSWHSTLLKYPFDLSRPASDRRQWSGLDKATIWVDPFQTGAFDPRSNVQEVLIVKLYSSNRMRAGRVSRHFPTSTFDEHGRVECVEDVEFGPDSCNALGQAFIHVPLPSMYSPGAVPPVSSLTAPLHCAYVQYERPDGRFVWALQIDLYFLQQSMRF